MATLPWSVNTLCWCPLFHFSWWTLFVAHIYPKCPSLYWRTVASFPPVPRMFWFPPFLLPIRIVIIIIIIIIILTSSSGSAWPGNSLSIWMHRQQEQLQEHVKVHVQRLKGGVVLPCSVVAEHMQKAWYFKLLLLYNKQRMHTCLVVAGHDQHIKLSWKKILLIEVDRKKL